MLFFKLVMLNVSFSHFRLISITVNSDNVHMHTSNGVGEEGFNSDLIMILS